AVGLRLCRLWLGDRVGVGDVLRTALVPVLAIAVVTAANAKLTGNLSPSPYGKIFILTRVLIDGPGQRALQRECPRPDWTLCGFKDRIPQIEDDILFGEEEVVSYHASKQYHLVPLLPETLQAVHLGVASVALIVLLIGGVAALVRRRPLGGLYAGIAAALLANAFVGGALSGVFDRYQSRFV